MRKRIIGIIALAGILTGCGSSDTMMNDSYATNSWDGAYLESASYTDSVGDYEYESKSSVADDSEANIVLQNAMIAKDVNVGINVENLEVFSENLTQKVQEAGGYFEETDINDYSSDYSTERYGYFIIRIPSSNLDNFMEVVSEEGSVTSSNVKAEDVSLEYVDNNAKIAALENEKKALEGLMQYATSTSEIIEIQDRLSDVQYQLDSANGRKRYLEGRVNYSYVRINATESRYIDNPVGRAFSVNLKERFLDSMETLVEIFVSLLFSIPTIIIVTAFIILFVWVLKKVVKKVFKVDKLRGKHIVLKIEDIDAIKSLLEERKDT